MFSAATSTLHGGLDTFATWSTDNFNNPSPVPPPSRDQSGSLQGHDCEGMPDTIADGLRTTLGSTTWPVVRLVACYFSLGRSPIQTASHVFLLVSKKSNTSVRPGGGGSTSATSPVAQIPVYRPPYGESSAIENVG